jgi:hypothetical protein
MTLYCSWDISGYKAACHQQDQNADRHPANGRIHAKIKLRIFLSHSFHFGPFALSLKKANRAPDKKPHPSCIQVHSG